MHGLMCYVNNCIFSLLPLSLGRGTLDSSATKKGLGGATDGGGAHAIV